MRGPRPRLPRPDKSGLAMTIRSHALSMTATRVDSAAHVLRQAQDERGWFLCEFRANGLHGTGALK